MKVRVFLALTVFWLLSISLIAETKLINASVIFRHGDRTPTKPIPACSYDWMQGFGELTPEGMHQEYISGTELRKRYVNDYKLLPEDFETKTLYVRSTDFNRTLQSAESLLYGLYLPGTGPLLKSKTAALPYKYQPIPIHAFARQNDILLLKGMKGADKKKMKEILSKYVYSSDEWLNKQKSLEKYFPLWTKASGTKISSLLDAKSFAGNVYIRTLHNVSLPKGIDDKQKEILIGLALWIHAQQFKPIQAGILIAGDFLKNIVTTMNKCIANESQVKCYLYSAHDKNLLSVMSALGVPLDKNPGYASRIQFELYKEDNSCKVKIFFNNENIKLPFADNNDFCTFSAFENYINSF